MPLNKKIKKLIPKMLKSNLQFSRKQIMLFMAVFALIGGYTIYRSFAAAPLVATLEAEQMSLPAGGSVVTDTTASSGKALYMPSSATITGLVNFASPVNSVTVVAKGGQCNGAPTMNVVLDGTTLLNAAAVSSTNWAPYSASLTNQVAAGTHTLSISFVGDYTKNKGNPRNQCSRTLSVDVSNFYGPLPVQTPAPTVSLSATPSTLAAGDSATLTWNSTDATSCSASGAWSGTQPTSGSVSTGALNQSSTYTLTCTGAGGSASASAVVSVSSLVTSPDNTVVNGTNGQIVDANRHVWSINASGQIVVDGVVDTTTSGVLTLAYESGKVWQKNINNLWWYKISPSDTWLPTGGTSVSPIPSGTTSSWGTMYGYSAHILWQSDQANYVSLLANSGAKTVRDDFNWAAIEPSLNTYNWSGPDNMVTQTANAGMNMLAMAGYGPGWATVCGSDKCGPSNNSYYADFVKQIALRYGNNGTFWSSHPSVPKHPLAGIEIWNEPNLGGFWANPSPAAYTSMLKAAYPAIKSADPNMTVISAGLAPVGGYNDGNCDGTADGGWNGSRLNGINFLQQMYQNGAGGYMDAVAYHPYNWGTGSSSSYFNYHVCSAWSQVNDTPISVRSLMNQYGDGNKKVWATEVGATTASGYYTESDQATLATNLMSKWKSYSWASNLYWYDIRNDGTDITNTEHNFGTVRHDSSLKPAYSALKTAWQ